jgi:hypothetical protein
VHNLPWADPLTTHGTQAYRADTLARVLSFTIPTGMLSLAGRVAEAFTSIPGGTRPTVLPPLACFHSLSVVWSRAIAIGGNVSTLRWACIARFQAQRPPSSPSTTAVSPDQFSLRFVICITVGRKKTNNRWARYRTNSPMDWLPQMDNLQASHVGKCSTQRGCCGFATKANRSESGARLLFAALAFATWDARCVQTSPRYQPSRRVCETKAQVT